MHGALVARTSHELQSKIKSVLAVLIAAVYLIQIALAAVRLFPGSRSVVLATELRADFVFQFEYLRVVGLAFQD